MSVKTLESYQEFTADGTTTYFTFNFNYVDSSEIVVGMRTGENTYEIIDPAHYVLTQNASTDGGKIRFVTTKPCENPDDPTCGDYIDNPPPAGTIVRIERKTVQSSTADWYVGLDTKALVGLFDKLFRISQENSDKFKNTIQTFPTQQGITIRELLSEHDKKIFYWNNEKQWLDITDFTIDDVVRQTDVGDILDQANAYSDEQNAVLENRINGKLTAIDSQIDANADAIQKTREDYINADSEIRQILDSHTDELTTLRGNQASLGDQVSGIEEKIPGSASAANQLATKQDLANIKVDLTGYATETYVNTREQKIRDDVNAEDSRLQSQITAQATAITANTNNINGVKALVPSGTSTSNPLINKQQLLDEEMDIREDLNESVSELQTQITAQAAEIATKQDKLTAGDNIIISNNVISATGAGGGTGFDAVVVQTLPATGQKGIIYLVPKDGTAPDIYDEYVWITSTQTFELIGTTQVDLTNYATKTELNAKQNKLTAAGDVRTPVYFDGTQLKTTKYLKAEMVYGGLDGEIYYAHHPEMNNMHIFPFIYNDFAFIDKKGGSYTVTRSDNGEITNPQFIFDAAPSYMLSRGYASDTVWTVEISTLTKFTYSTLLYVDFGTPGFACSYIKVEAQHSVTGEWKTVLEKTDNALSYVYCKCASDDVGVNKFRFTFKNPLSSVQFRLSSIGAISFKSAGIEETVLTLKGGTVFGDVIAPNITNIQNAVDGKVNIAQGAENAGKILKVDDSGNVVVGEGGGGDYLPLSGGTLTGTLSFHNQNYSIRYTTFGLTMKLGVGSDAFSFRNKSGNVYFAPVVNLAATLGTDGTFWANVYTAKLNNGADLIVPTEGGTLARLEDLEGIGGSSLPDQAGNEGKVLTTNGTDAEWADMPGLIIRRL